MKSDSGIDVLFHYVDEDHIDSLLEYADLFTHEAYYARMAGMDDINLFH